MPTFRQGEVIKVPFPYTDRATRQWQPALVVSSGGVEDRHGLLWVAMITSAENRGWPGDIAVSDLRHAGLPVPSVVRSAKIATIEAADAVHLGRLAAAACDRAHRQGAFRLRRVTGPICVAATKRRLRDSCTGSFSAFARCRLRPTSSGSNSTDRRPAPQRPPLLDALRRRAGLRHQHYGQRQQRR